MTSVVGGAVTSYDDAFAGVFTPSGVGSFADAATAAVAMTTTTTTTTTVVVSPGFETEILIDSIESVPLSKIGSDAFLRSYCVNLERLSVQAHLTAAEGASAAAQAALSVSSGGAMAMAMAAGAGAGEDEYVVEAFMSRPKKIEALVHTLLALELWRTRALFGPLPRVSATEAIADADDGRKAGRAQSSSSSPQKNDDAFLAGRLATNGNALRAAFVLHVETTIISLLNLIFHRGIPVAKSFDGGDDALLSLVDYCARSLVFLATPPEFNPALDRQKRPRSASDLSEYLLSRNRLEEIRDACLDVSYRTAVASVALARYLCEGLDASGPSLVSRILDVHDYPLLFANLIEEPPWTRRRKVIVRGKTWTAEAKTETETIERMIWEKLDDDPLRGGGGGERVGRVGMNLDGWLTVHPSDLLRLTTREAQPWLGLYHLTCSSAVCRASYKLDDYRKSRLMRLRRYVQNGAVVDQLPVLADVGRYLDELSVLGVPAGVGGSGGSAGGLVAAVASGALLLERVDEVRESVLAECARGSVDRGGIDEDRGARRRNTTDANVDGSSFWADFAERQYREVFSLVTDSKDAELRRIASEVYGGSGFDSAEVACETKKGGSGIKNSAVAAKTNGVLPQDDWKIVASQPLEKVVLRLTDGFGCGESEGERDESGTTFELIPADENGSAAETVAQTPLGPFRRIKLSVHSRGGDGGPVRHDASAIAEVHFRPASASAVASSCMSSSLPVDIARVSIESLSLPTAEGDRETSDTVGVPVPDHLPKKEWRQVGAVSDRGVVVQLGFRRSNRGCVRAGTTALQCYSLSQAFLSQPVLEEY